MWRDVSRSAFVFGFGTFIIVSSSYAKDINLRLEISYAEFFFLFCILSVYNLLFQNRTMI